MRGFFLWGNHDRLSLLYNLPLGLLKYCFTSLFHPAFFCLKLYLTLDTYVSRWPMGPVLEKEVDLIGHWEALAVARLLHAQNSFGFWWCIISEFLLACFLLTIPFRTLTRTFITTRAVNMSPATPVAKRCCKKQCLFYFITRYFSKGCLSFLPLPPLLSRNQIFQSEYLASQFKGRLILQQHYK